MNRRTARCEPHVKKQVRGTRPLDIDVDLNEGAGSAHRKGLGQVQSAGCHGYTGGLISL